MAEPCIPRIVYFYQSDIEAARARGVGISDTNRELFHAFMSGDSTDDANMERIMAEVKALRDQKKDIVTRLSIKETLLADLQKKQHERAEAAAKAEEERRHAATHCFKCGYEIGKGTRFSIIKHGPHKGKPVCGTIATGCLKVVMEDNREWMT